AVRPRLRRDLRDDRGPALVLADVPRRRRLRYGDVVEREIHNALAASLDAGGTRFFYANPLQSRPDKHSEESAPRERLPWYPCACCPPNIARAVAQMGAYVASVT